MQMLIIISRRLRARTLCKSVNKRTSVLNQRVCEAEFKDSVTFQDWNTMIIQYILS